MQYSWDRPSWFDAVGEEWRNTARNMTLFDHSCFIKYLVSGPDACAALNHVSAGQVGAPVGKVIYTQ